MSFIIKTITNVATDWKLFRVHWLLLQYKIAPIFSRSWLQQIIGPCALTSVPEKVWSSLWLFLGAPYNKTLSVCAGHYIAYITHRVYIHQCPFKTVKDWNNTVMIYSIILLQYIIFLFFVNYRNFCKHKWNEGIFFLQKSNFRCRENIYICRPLRCLRHLAIEYVKNYIPVIILILYARWITRSNICI